MAGRIAVRRSALLHLCILAAAVATTLLVGGRAAASVTTPEGPIAAWSFDEGEGTIAHDATGWHDGTIEGARWGTGKYGSGLRFEDGESQCVTVPNSSELEFENGEFTFEAWVKPEHWLGSAPILFKEAEPGHGQSYTFGIGMTEYGHVEGWSENAAVYSPGKVEEGSWLHISFTYDGSVERIYLDGELVASKSVGERELAGSGPLKIGCAGPEYGGQFKGRIDEVRAYARALDEAEIKTDEETPIGRPARRRPAIAAWGFDEGEGTVAHDATGAGHTGTVEGPEWTSGKFGSGLDFLDNEKRQCVTVPDSSELEFPNEEFTFEAWVKPEHWLGSASILFKEAEPGHGMSYTFGIGMTKYGHVEGWSENAVVYSPGTVEENTWLHIAFTYDGNEEHIYLDGKLVSSETIGKRNLAGSGPVKIGCSGPEYGGQFFGVVDEVRAYDRALTEAEIAEDEATPVDIPGPSQAPVAEYSFDEDKGEVAEDLTGNGHTATVHGAEWTEHGRYGGALQFDASKHDHLSIPSSPGLDFDEEFTLEAWVRPESEENVAAPVMAKEVGGGSASETVAYHLFEGWSEPNRPAAGLESEPGNEQTAVASEPLPVDGWSHLAVSYDGSELRLYVNGQKVAEEAAPHGPMVTEGELQIGALTEHNNYFDGRIDEVRIYNRALNAEEVGADLGTPIQTPRRGPVAEYSFDQEASLGEDSSYGGPDATVEGATWTPKGRYGGAVLLNGKEDSLSIPSSPGLDLGEEFTLEAWVRPEGENKWAPLISKEREGTKEEPWFLYEGSWKSNLPYGGLEGETADETISNANEQIPENRWTHLALTFDGTKTRLYVDGELVDEDAGTRPAAGEGRIDIGADASGNYFDGRIDEVRLYNRALAGGEVAASMEAPIQTPKAGPVAAWSFDEGTGETAADSAGEHDLTLEGPKWAPHGKFGSALDFNGGYEDCARTPNAEDLQLGEDFTISAWIKPEGNGEHEAILFKEAEYTGGYALYLGEFEDGHIEGYVGEPGYQFATTEDPKAMPHNAWTDVTLTFDGSDLRLFVNGELVDTASAKGAQSSGGPLSVGCSGEFHDGFIGGIDNVRIYNRALNAGEVASDMEAPIQTPKSGPVAEYSFDEGTGETVQDATGDGNTATIHGAEWTEHGRYGDAMEFEGGEDCLTIPVTEELQLTDEFTLEAWVRPVGGGEEALPVISMADEHSPGAEEPYGYELLAGQNERPKAWVRTGSESGFRGVYGAGPLSQNTWAHITLTDDGEKIRLYEDGHLAEGGLSTNAAPYLTTAEGPLEIGCGVFNGSFKGRIDEVRVYNRALDEAEVSSDMEAPIQTPKQGPVAAYSFDEGEGSTVEDLTGDEHTATVHGARWTDHGKYGGAMEFNAARESYLSIPDSPELDFSEAFTLEAWVRPGEESGKYGPLITKQTTGSRAQPYFLYEGSWEPDRPYGGTDENTEVENPAVSPDTLPTNVWSHLALTFDGSKSRLYINGELVAVKSGSPPVVSEGDLEIGGATEVGSYFSGRIDEARIYNRALTAQEAKSTTPPKFISSFAATSVTYEGETAVSFSEATDASSSDGITPEYLYRYAINSGAFGSWVSTVTNSFVLKTPEEEETIKLQVYASDAAGNRSETESALLTVSPPSQLEPDEAELQEVEEESEQPGNRDERFAGLQTEGESSGDRVGDAASGGGAPIPKSNECIVHANDPHRSTSLAQQGQNKIKASGFAECGSQNSGASLVLVLELEKEGPAGFYLLPQATAYYRIGPMIPYIRVGRPIKPVKCENGKYFLRATIEPGVAPVNRYWRGAKAYHTSDLVKVDKC